MHFSSNPILYLQGKGFELSVLQQAGLSKISERGGATTLKVPPLLGSTVPQLAPCASSARAWRLCAARHSQVEAQATGDPSHRLECSSEPPPRSPISLPLAL